MEYTAARRFFQVLIQYKGKKIQSAESGAQNDRKLNLIAHVLAIFVFITKSGVSASPAVLPRKDEYLSNTALAFLRSRPASFSEKSIAIIS